MRVHPIDRKLTDRARFRSCCASRSCYRCPTRRNLEQSMTLIARRRSMLFAGQGGSGSATVPSIAFPAITHKKSKQKSPLHIEVEIGPSRCVSFQRVIQGPKVKMPVVHVFNDLQARISTGTTSKHALCALTPLFSSARNLYMSWTIALRIPTSNPSIV